MLCTIDQSLQTESFMIGWIVTPVMQEHIRGWTCTVNTVFILPSLWVCTKTSKKGKGFLFLFSTKCDVSLHRVETCTEMLQIIVNYDDERVINIAGPLSWSILCHAFGFNALHYCFRNEARYSRSHWYSNVLFVIFIIDYAEVAQAMI